MGCSRTRLVVLYYDWNLYGVCAVCRITNPTHFVASTFQPRCKAQFKTVVRVNGKPFHPEPAVTVVPWDSGALCTKEKDAINLFASTWLF